MKLEKAARGVRFRTGAWVGCLALAGSLILGACDKKQEASDGTEKSASAGNEAGSGGLGAHKVTATKEDLFRIFGSIDTLVGEGEDAHREQIFTTFLSDGSNVKTFPHPPNEHDEVRSGNRVTENNRYWISGDAKKIYFAKILPNIVMQSLDSQNVFECTVPEYACKSLLPNSNNYFWRYEGAKGQEVLSGHKILPWLGAEYTRLNMKNGFQYTSPTLGDQAMNYRHKRYFIDDFSFVRVVDLQSMKVFSMAILSGYILPISGSQCYVNYYPKPDVCIPSLIDVEKKDLVKTFPQFDSTLIPRSSVDAAGDKILTPEHLNDSVYTLILYDNRFNVLHKVRMPDTQTRGQIDPSGNWFVYTDSVALWRVKLSDVFDGSQEHDSAWLAKNSQCIYPFIPLNGEPNPLLQFEVIEGR